MSVVYGSKSEIVAKAVRCNPSRLIDRTIVADHTPAQPPDNRLDFGCGSSFLLFFVVLPVVGWIVYPLGRAAFGSSWPYLFMAILGVVLLWPILRRLGEAFEDERMHRPEDGE
jgi:hypothetical protein